MKMIRLMMLWIVALCAAICSAETFSYNGCEYRTVEDTEFGKSVALVSFNRDIAENGELVLDSRVFKDGDEEGYSVVQIEERTLSKLQTVKSIIFPEKLLEIKNINISNLRRMVIKLCLGVDVAKSEDEEFSVVDAVEFSPESLDFRVY